MKNLLLLITYLIIHNSSFCQNVILETFDSKESIKSWNISNNNSKFIHHTNQFSYKGKAFTKGQKDSFLALYDDSDTLDYSIRLNRSFKMVPCESINISFSLYSDDTLNDNVFIGYRLFDKKGETVYTLSFPNYCRQSPVNIAGIGIPFMEKDDTLWRNVDSINIRFTFGPANPNKKLERKLIIDNIHLENTFTLKNTYKEIYFEAYPNPVKNILNLHFNSTNTPQRISLLDYTGNYVYQNNDNLGQNVQLNFEQFTKGFYILSVLFKNGEVAFKKIELN